jgi:3-polyprenyl-4-hydroxybenzoate decarboxylase
MVFDCLVIFSVRGTRQQAPCVRGNLFGAFYQPSQHQEDVWPIGTCAISSLAWKRRGELKRVTAEVDPVLEITEITQRVTRAGGPALLFERPKGSRFPCSSTCWAAKNAFNLALEVDRLEEVSDRIRSFIDVQVPQGILDKLKMLPKLAELGAFFPRRP